MKAINYKEAKRITEQLGLCFNGSSDNATFYATTDNENSIFEFDSKKERDTFVKKCNEGK